jgi:hypothetical protein
MDEGNTRLQIKMNDLWIRKSDPLADTWATAAGRGCLLQTLQRCSSLIGEYVDSDIAGAPMCLTEWALAYEELL